MRPRQAGRPTVGAPNDPRYGCAVNMPESASGLIRFTPPRFPCGVALTGGEAVPAASGRQQSLDTVKLGSKLEAQLLCLFRVREPA